jgi:protein TonB
MGGDHNSFTLWVANNLKYPEEAARNGIQGRVYLKFMIDFDGSVKNVEVLSGTDRLLMEEARRVVSSSPAWNPGMQRGKPAQVTFTFPVTFRLQ